MKIKMLSKTKEPKELLLSRMREQDPDQRHLGQIIMLSPHEGQREEKEKKRRVTVPPPTTLSQRCRTSPDRETLLKTGLFPLDLLNLLKLYQLQST